MTKKDKIRNIAIIAHIDHGKTTMLDSMLKQSNLFRDNEHTEERMMDSYDQEKERGITIFSKNTSIDYKGYKINIIDTPGHADFSGEVERCLGMVDSVLLLVDAKEGPMPQTRFVLLKSLKLGLKPIVILNKIDRPQVDPDRVLDETFDLFAELGATDDQLDFTHCYASGLNGFAMREMEDSRKDMTPLFDLITEKVPPPEGNLEDPFLFQVSTLIYDDYVGRQGCGRILNGTVKKGDYVIHIDRDKKEVRSQITRVQGFHGLEMVEIPEGSTGDIIILSGIPEITIGDTLCSEEKIIQLPPINIEEPTVSIDIMVNSSPLMGKDGKHVTMNKIRDRLMREKRANITYRFENSVHNKDAITVSGRGELHLSVLIEALRREGFEMSLSKPQVITKKIEGTLCEPLEKVHIEVPQEYSGAIIEELSKRKGEMQHLSTNEHGLTSLEFIMPTRGLIGFRNDFLTMTRGLGILTSIFDHFSPWKGNIPGRLQGVLVCIGSGKSNAYACYNLQDRSILFIPPGEDVYEGMVVGLNSRDNDLVVNITKGKQLTNVRASGTDESLILAPHRTLTLEQAIDFIQEDEWVEVTPKQIRLRKKFLKEVDRKREQRKKN